MDTRAGWAGEFAAYRMAGQPAGRAALGHAGADLACPVPGAGGVVMGVPVLPADRAGELPGFAGRPGDEMGFAVPVIAAAGLAGGVTAVNILLLAGEAGSRDRMVKAERAIAGVQPDWTGAAERAVTALCPGWAVRYCADTGQWRARRTDGSGYWPDDSPRAYAVWAPSALCLLARVEQQALLDIAEVHRWLVWPSGSAWYSVPDEDTADGAACLLSAGTAAALAVAIGQREGS
jgi:hypothetical protein